MGTTGKSDNIKDVLDEFVSLKDCSILIGEYIPFGANNVYQFCNKLDASKRVKSAMLTEYKDKDPKGTIFEASPIHTAVEILDFVEHRFVEFNSHISYPEQEGIEQMENFGVRIDYFGRIIYGLQLKDINGDRNISIDRITRVNADLVQDSSRLLNSLLTNHQRELVNLIFSGHSLYRDKYVGIIASSISPDFEEMEKYMDSGPFENEMKQVLEYISAVKKVSDGTKIFVGTHGMVLVGQNAKKYEVLASHFLFLKALQIFLSNFFSRIWLLEERLKSIRSVFLKEGSWDPRSISWVQTEITTASYHCVLLVECLKFLAESIREYKSYWADSCQEVDQDTKAMINVLKIDGTIESCGTRIQDAEYVLDGVSNEVKGIREQITVFNEKRLQSIFQQLKTGNAVQVKVQRAAEHQDSKMKVIEIVMSGSLALSLVSTIVGEYSFVSSGAPFVPSPIYWLAINIGIWLMFSLGVFLLVNRIRQKAEKILLVKLNVEKPIDRYLLEDFLGEFCLKSSDIEEVDRRVLKTVKCEMENCPQNPFGKEHVVIEIAYDITNEFLYSIDMEIATPMYNELYYKNTILDELQKKKILKE